MKCVFAAILVSMSMQAIAAMDYHGFYRISGLEIRYFVPSPLIGRSEDIYTNNEFNDKSDLRIFWSYLPEIKFWKIQPGGGGLSMGLSPMPKELLGDQDLASYSDFYKRQTEGKGIYTKVASVRFSDINWVRIEEFSEAGNLIRVLYVEPINPEYLLVCRIGMIDDLVPDYKNPHWAEWLPAMTKFMKSITVTRSRS